MLKACSKCGRIHHSKHKCTTGQIDYIKDDRLKKFRSSSAWIKKREQIKMRDMYMCQYCLKELGKVNNRQLSVHHIKPHKDNWDLRLEESNLITLCSVHHALIDNGQINIPPTLRQGGF